MQAGDLDALLEFVPDEVIDKVIDARRCRGGGGEPSWLRFSDVLQVNEGVHLYLDSFAVRHLAHGAPAALALLSAVRVSPERYLQRCAVTGAGGEEAVLSFEMLQQDCLQSQYKGPPLVRKRWMLRSVRGEPAREAAAARPAPAHPPEAVLASQLAALREQRFTDVFAHASPANKGATGPVTKFARMLHAPAYAPLLGHAGAESLQRLQPSADVFMELVRVRPAGGGGAGAAGGGAEAAGAAAALAAAAGARGGGGGGVTYLWVLSRQAAGGPHGRCWMVDSVQPVDPPAPGALPPPPLTGA